MKSLIALSALGLLALAGCRGWTSPEPPVHLNPNMDTQKKHKPYRADSFFADGRSMRTPPAGTVGRTVSGNAPRDWKILQNAPLIDDSSLMFTGVNKRDMVPDQLPSGFNVDNKMLERGQERYNIYCAPCHARHGTGTGLVASRLTVKPPTFHDDTRVKMPVAHYFRIMTHGKPLPEDLGELKEGEEAKLNMPSYAAQIDVEDRWAIAAYIRALQLTQRKSLPTAKAYRVGGAVNAALPADSDFDSVPDSVDKCPDEKEVINGIDDDDGCPDEGESKVVFTATKIDILDKVFFETGSAKIKRQSFGLLNQVARTILAHADTVAKVRVEGHTDNKGEPEANLNLSKRRAESVVAYLISRGLPGDMLAYEGFGQEKPIADNGTKTGRAKNRRVEFQIVSE